MDYRTKEFLVAQIRSGTFIEGEIILVSPTLDQIIESHHIYNKSYDEALDSELMTEEDLRQVMEMNGLWTNLDEDNLKTFDTEIDDIKFNMYQTRKETVLLNKKRKVLRRSEKERQIELDKKNGYYSQSCEAFAESERVSWLLSKTTFVQGKIYEGDTTYLFNKSHLAEHIVRELARSEPWRSYFLIYKNNPSLLFLNKPDQDLTYNQRNIFAWSQTYNSLVEAHEPPSEQVVEDDDLLDGWFIAQKRKKEKEDFDKKIDDKVSDAQGNQIFIPVDKEEGINAESIYKMNDPHAQATIKERNDYIDKNGETEFTKFPEYERQKLIDANKAMKSKR